MDTGEAERYLMGGGPEEESAVWEEHLLVCGRCREQLEATGDYLSTMCDAAAEIRAHPEEHDWRLSYLWGGVAAGAGVLVVSLLGLRYYPPAVEIRLVNNTTVTAPAGRNLELRLEGAGERVEIVSASGETWRRELTGRADRVAVPGQQGGTYLVRVRARSGELRREYRLEIR
jgi:hypothetical protein